MSSLVNLRRTDTTALVEALERLAAGDLDGDGERLAVIAERRDQLGRAARAALTLRRRLSLASEAAEALAEGRQATLTGAEDEPIGRSFADALAAQRETLEVVTALAAGDLDVVLRHTRGELRVALERLLGYLRGLEAITRDLAEGDFSSAAWEGSDRDLLRQNIVGIQTYLKDVAWAAERIASGDLTAEVSMRSQRDLLGASLAQMVEGLRQIVGAVAEAASTAMASSQRLAESGSETGEVTREIARAVAEVIDTSERSDALHGAAQPAESAGETIASSIRRLGARSAEISGIVQTITTIAGQTNLLALNAAIEAARAGEQGRGFAVVAEEVRKLAEEVQRSAVAIGDLVGAITADTQRAVELVNAEDQRAEERERAVGQARDGFDSIGQAVDEIAATAESLAETARELDRVVASFRLQPPGVPFRCALNADWTMETIGERILDLTGYPASDFIGNQKRTYGSIIHPDDAVSVEQKITAAVKAGKSYTIQYRIIDSRGQVRTVEEHGRAVISRHGGIAWLDGVLFPV